MVARDYCRSQIQRYVRPRFAEPIENATRINNNRNKRIKLKKTTTRI